MASSSSTGDSPSSYPLTPLAQSVSSVSSSSADISSSSSSRVAVSPYPPLPSSGPSSPSLSPPPPSVIPILTSGPGYTPLNDVPLSSKAKGKGRAVIQQDDGYLDLERGQQQWHEERRPRGDSRKLDDEENMVRAGWDKVEELNEADEEEGRQSSALYPPLNDEEKEEKRIAETLALWKERDLAKRRAARESKQLKSAAGSRSGSLSSIPSMRLPGGANKRWSIWSNGGESPAVSPPHTATSFLPAYTSQTPTSSANASSAVPTSFSSSSGPSTFQPGHQPNMSTASADYEYRGREWMGGATKQPRQRRQEIGFWENLCGTGNSNRAPGESAEDGSDESDGEQAGRTNPFE